LNAEKTLGGYFILPHLVCVHIAVFLLSCNCQLVCTSDECEWMNERRTVVTVSLYWLLSSFDE